MLPHILFLSRFIIFTIGFIFLGYVLGGLLSIKDKPILGRAGSFALSVTVGWGILGILMMILGFLGRLDKPSVTLVLSVAALLGILRIYSRYKANFCPPSSWSIHSLRSPEDDLAVLIFSAILLLGLFILSLYPVTAFDATQYHLPAAKSFIANKDLSVDPFIRFHPPNMVNLFFSFSLLLGNSIYAGLTQFTMAIICAMLIQAFWRVFIGNNRHFIPSLIFICSPLVIVVSTTPFSETATALFCFAAFFSMCLWAKYNKVGFLLVSALLWATALGTKNTAVLFFFCAFPAVIFCFWKQINKFHLIIAVIIIFIIAFPWYLRNKYYAGDWFFPLFLDKTCDQLMWNLSDLQRQVKQLRIFGMGYDLKSLILLPYNLIMHGSRFEGSLGVFVPFAFGAAFFVKKMDRQLRLVSFICGLYLAIWFYNFQVVRYLSPILPFLCLLASWVLVKFVLRENKKLVAALVIAVLFSGMLACFRQLRLKGPLPITRQERLGFVAKTIPTYKAIEYLNKAGHPDDIVYSLFDESSALFYKKKVIGDWFGPGRYEDILFYVRDPDKLRDVLIKKFNVKYLFIKKNYVLSATTLDALRGASGFEVVYEDNNALIVCIQPSCYSGLPKMR